MAIMSKHDLLETALPPLLDAFYARVREDGLIGPVFNDAVHDWPAHLARGAASQGGADRGKPATGDPAWLPAPEAMMERAAPISAKVR